MTAMKGTGVLGNLSVEKTILLIELYQTKECLWNNSLPSYRDLMLKKDEWTNLRVNFTKRTGIECTDDNIQRKIQALRNTYTRELRICRNSKKSADIRASKWTYFNALTFLRGVITLNPETPDISNLTPATSSSPESQNQGEGDVKTALSQPSTSYDTQEPSQPADAEPAATPYRPATVPSRPFKRKRTEGLLQSSLSQCSTEDRCSKEEDSTSIWAKHLGSTLNLIKNERRRILARIEVEQVLHKYLREDLSQ